MNKDFFNRLDISPGKLYALLTVVSFIIILVFSPFSSISTPYFFYDTSVYALIGKAWWGGDFIPYRDFFDHKGPLVYSFFALAAACGHMKWGLTILQTFFMACSLYAAYRVSRYYTKPMYAWVVLGLMVYVFVAYNGCGCNTEEISLPFSFVALVLFLKNLRSDFRFPQGNIKAFWDFLVIGACVGVNLMIRPNNAVAVCCCCLITAAYMVAHQRWRHLFHITVTCCLGCLLVCLPYIAYFYFHSALDDYIYANFIYNMKYAAHGHGLSGVGAQFLRFPFLLLLPVCVWAFAKRSVIGAWEVAWIVLLAMASFAVTCMGKQYNHYVILSLPAHVCLCSLVFRASERERGMRRMKCLLPLVVMFALGVVTVGSQKDRNVGMSLKTSIGYFLLQSQEKVTSGFLLTTHRMYSEAKMLAQYIPNNEKHDVLNLNMFGNEYLYMETLPCCPYFIIQESMILNGGTEMKNNILNAVNDSKPKWLLTYPSVVRFFPMGNYELKAATTHYHLYRIKE